MKAGVIDAMQLRSALGTQDQWGGRLTRVLTDLGLADEDAMVNAISQALRTPSVKLGTLPKDPAALAKLDTAFCESAGVYPIALKDNGKTLLLAMTDPSDLTTLDEAGRRARARVIPHVVGEIDLWVATERHYKNREVSPQEVAARRKFVRREAPKPTTGPEEFKITDMAGKTMMRNVSDLHAQLKAPPGQSAAPVSGAGDLLDDLLAGSPAKGPTFTSEELQRVEAAQLNQEKSRKIVRAVAELLIEKRVMTQAELQTKLKG